MSITSPAESGMSRAMPTITLGSSPRHSSGRSARWNRATTYLLGAAAPLALTALVTVFPEAWPRPYSWQYLGVTIAVAMGAGVGAGLMSLSVATAAVWWQGVPTPVHPGVEMFAAVGFALVAIIDRYRRTDNELRNRALVLHAIIEAMPDAVYVGTPGGITLCNTNALRMLGAGSLADLQARIDQLGRTFDVRWPDTGQRLRDDELQFTRALRGETAVEEVLATNPQTGRDIVVRSACAPIFDGREVVGAVAINSDVTDRRRAEDALRESERRYRTALDQMLEGCAIVGRDWKFRYVNDAYACHVRLDRERMLGNDIRELLPGIEHTEFFGPLTRSMQNGTAESVEAEYVFPDGIRGWYEVRVRSVDEGIFVLTLDVSERQRAVHGLEAARRSAEQARAAAEEANRAKDHFLAVLSHELRTPLTPVLAGIALLQRDLTLSAETQNYVEVLRRNIEVEARIIDDLLDVTRITHGKVDLRKRPVELRSVVERAIEVCQPDLDARRVHFGIDDSLKQPCFVDADAARLQQVFWNLLKNAIKFTPADGCIGIRLRSEDGHALIDVTDSGVGIRPGDLPIIFDAFAQAERTLNRHFGGLGLGLTISRALVEQHGGTISAHSDGPGKGATFSVRIPVLPLTAGTEPRKSAWERRRQERAPRALRILVVEDHGDSAEMMAAMLEGAGHRVEIAGDVSAALEAASGAPFDVIVSDLGLPDRSGIDLLRALRARGQQTPAIAVSGYGQEEDVQRSLTAGFSTHLVKPIDVAKLMDAIDTTVTARES